MLSCRELPLLCWFIYAAVELFCVNCDAMVLMVVWSGLMSYEPCFSVTGA